MPAKSSRLGRGLDALIPTNIDEFASEEITESLQLDEKQVQEVSVDLVDPNPFQPRKEFDDVSLAELADSIKTHGVVQPLVVTKAGQRYQLIAGERRLRASKLANIATVPVVIRSFDQQDQLEIAVIENIQRSELSLLELAVAYQKLVDQFNLSIGMIARRVGKSRPTVSNIIRLLNLPYTAKKALQEGKIVEGHARMLLTIDNPIHQEHMLQLIIKKDLTVRQAEELSRNYKEDKELVSPRVKQTETAYKSATDGLAKRLDTKVSISLNAKGGKVQLRFYSEEELQRIYKAITGEDLL